MSENSRRYLKALHAFDAVVARTAPDAWDGQSPCADWNAADVVAHNVGMNRMIAGFARGEGAAGPSQGPTDDPAGTWSASLAEVMQALDTEGALHTVAATPWGEMPVDNFLSFVWVDPLIHTWDLAQATGQDPVLPADLVERGAIQLERAGDSLVGPGRFDAAVAVGDGAAMLDRFIALSGRTP